MECQDAPIAHPHDHIVRKVMSDLRLAREFFAIHLPEHIRQVIELESLELLPGSFIDKMLEETRMDLLYRVKFINWDGYLYLMVEHQSTPNKLMPIRMNQYACNVIEHYLKKGKGRIIPAIYRVLIYHGRKKYPYSLEVEDYVDSPPLLAKEFCSLRVQLVDFRQIDDEQLKKNDNIGVMEYILKHTYEKDLLPFLREIADKLRLLDQTGYRDYLHDMLHYAIERGEARNPEAFFDLVTSRVSVKIGGEVMTIAEQLRYEGMQVGIQRGHYEGKLEGKLEVAKRLLAEGVDIAFVAKVSGLPRTKIKELEMESAP